MQSRVTFNAGELAPELSCRADLDQYNHGCSKLENWVVSELGGLKRRNGMRLFSEAIGADSRLVPYIYTYADTAGMRFLVEVGMTRVRVLDEGGRQVASFESGRMGANFSIDLAGLNWLQVNKLLFLTSLTSPPLVLELDNGEWSLRAWGFKNLPWRYNHEDRSEAVVVGESGGDITVQLPPTAEGALPTDTDFLRVSSWVDEQEAGMKATDILEGVTASTGGIPAAASPGDKFAELGELRYECFTCIAAWNSNDNYVEGLESPANYTANFRKATDNTSEFEEVTPIRSVKGNNFSKGAKIRVAMQYWHYWTCIKSTESLIPEEGKYSMSDYPEYFSRGVVASEAVPCQGSWSFYCGGLWYGEYEVRRNNESADVTADGWETRGVSRSNLTAAANVQCSGSESDAECYLRLFVTKSWALGVETSVLDVSKGFIPDSCNNRLIVAQYKHDEVLKVSMGGSVPNWTRVNKISVPQALGKSYDWSWAAFSERHGYPALAAVVSSRLVFAGTREQPQTLWFSRVDDLDNFLTGTVDDAAMQLTLNTVSQNPICWMKAQGTRLMLGTSESEFAIGGGQGGVITSKNAMAVDHSHVGSDGVTALAVIDKVLYVERGAGRVYEFGYNLETDGYISRDLSVLAPHIAKEHGGFIHSTLLRKPDTSAVFAMGDGEVALCTYNAHQEVKAWHRWWTSCGQVKDVCALPNGKKGDRLFLLVDNGVDCNILVVDEDSEFEDNGGNPYTSTLITNPLNNPLERNMRKQDDTTIRIKFGKKFDYDVDIENCGSIMLSPNAGADWYNLSIHDGEQAAGWLTQNVNGNFCVDKQIGLRCCAGELEVLAIQA
ncbi:MAG: hypothetical protein Q4C88_05880 [Akkermansia sp.]|nr:hypothetical protein [Akkermansia sp.]